MKQLLLLVTLVAACMIPAHAEENSMPESGIWFEPVWMLSPQDVWEFAPGIHLGSGKGGAAVSFFPYDYDSPRIFKDWTGYGVLMAGNFDLGEVPAAFRVWSKNPVYVDQDASKARSKNGEFAVLVFITPIEDCDRRLRKCSKAVSEVRVDEYGKVFADGKLIGSAILP